MALTILNYPPAIPSLKRSTPQTLGPFHLQESTEAEEMTDTVQKTCKPTQGCGPARRSWYSPLAVPCLVRDTSPSSLVDASSQALPQFSVCSSLQHSPHCALSSALYVCLSRSSRAAATPSVLASQSLIRPRHAVTEQGPSGRFT